MANRLDGVARTVSVLGGGQLGRMMALDGARLGLDVVCLDPAGQKSSAAPVCRVVEGSFTDFDNVVNLEGDVTTVEIEHVNVDGLEKLAEQGRPVHPAPSALRIIADKAVQKDVMAKRGVPIGDYEKVEPTVSAIREATEERLGGFPVMLKSRCMAYDGKGNAVIQSADGIEAALQSLGKAVEAGGVYLERWAPFKAELACIVARDRKGNTSCYDVVETRQADNICRVVVVPPSFPLPESARIEAQRVAECAVRAIEGAGVFAIEMFWMGGDRVLYNEMAPRPHNSGHLTIEACVTSQFEQHLRAVSGLPLGDPSLRVGAAAMINILGAASEEETLEALRPALTVPGAKVHWYGKDSRPGRKLGHITVTAPDMPELRRRLVQLGEPLDETDVETMGGKDGAAAASPVVGIIMGSDSDLPTMRACADMLTQFRVPFELSVVSAHRTPDRMYEYAKAAQGRGIRVIVAGAGGAAHLPGMVAALTPLPVIGVPVKTSTLNGQDSLLSIVQMPRGVPVATVAIGNSMNAGLLAVRMLAASEGAMGARLRGELDAYHTDQRDSVHEKAAHLENVKYEQYLSEYTNKDKTHLYLPRIRANINCTVDATDLNLTPCEGQTEVAKYVGKVRDRYDDGRNVVLVTTDRLTAFDRPLARIPFKGAVLNLVSLWWFSKTEHIIKNQLHASNSSANPLHPNLTLARRCKTFPIEFVMRGYIAGSSGTSMWTHYNKGVREYCGHSLPDGLRKNEKLEKNLCTPTTKSDEHDELISADTIVRDGWMSKEDWDFCHEKAQALFAFGQKVASEHGLILVDTKYEFGRDLETGEILLIDEIHTPDCSRYWVGDDKTHRANVEAGRSPQHIDKEFVRLWYTERCDPYKDEVLPEAPAHLVAELSRRYIMLYEKITGEPFPFPARDGGDANASMQRALDAALY
ncbi:Phosphoribosylaminoimidazole carboxylase [Hondaea fermentalgiana]|uniref:Phosphoribosylaminoimidazole carboxylase n=1 Tax=Hondaea fermentalgiana TaxID=2315210 RepID=A0A2R5GBC9_9STRA|nr:Phosphoribosylaminoimidazole carboxylase [Hondaea fermentalgiana]|eukprot:GBG25421.1 Phosphoribosylaminoimidazole carboxylase [Hondaea fermentalgiana]